MSLLPGNSRAQGSGGKITIHPVKSGECDRLAELHTNAFAHGWPAQEIQKLLQSPGIFGLVSRDISESAICGFILGRIVEDEGEIITVVVDPQFRNRNIGGGLMDEALKVFSERSTRKIFLEVAEKNDAAIKLYQRRKFVQVGRRSNYVKLASGERSDALLMCRNG